jgi:hypothetical protein
VPGREKPSTTTFPPLNLLGHLISPLDFGARTASTSAPKSGQKARYGKTIAKKLNPNIPHYHYQEVLMRIGLDKELLDEVVWEPQSILPRPARNPYLVRALSPNIEVSTLGRLYFGADPLSWKSDER